MLRKLVISSLAVLILVFPLWHCSKKDGDKSKAAEKSDQPPIPQELMELSSPLGIDEMHRILEFGTTHVLWGRTKGALPSPDGTPDPLDKADRAVKRIIYSIIAPYDFDAIYGFWMGERPKPGELDAYPPKHLRKIKVKLEVGPIEAADFAQIEPSPLPPEEKAADGDADRADSDADTEKTVIVKKAAPDGDRGEAEKAPPKKKPVLKPVFERTYLLPDNRNPQHWSFDRPIPVEGKRNSALQLTIDFLAPELDPTVPIIFQNSVGIVIHDLNRTKSAISEVAPIPKPKGSACYGSPRGQFICQFGSGAAELYIKAPFREIDLVGSWTKEGDKLKLHLEKKQPPFVIDARDPQKPFKFKDYGGGFVKIESSEDPRIHPYYDIARALAGDGPYSPDSIKDVWITQFDKGGDKEIGALLDDGSMAVFKRKDRYSPVELMTRLDAKGAKVKVVWVPNAARSFIGIKKPGDERWTVYTYIAFNDSWSSFSRYEVPWKPWRPDKGEIVVPHIPKTPPPPKDREPSGD